MIKQCHIYDQLVPEDDHTVPDKDQLIQFIQRITHRKDGWEGGRYDMQDLYQWVLRYYYSPFAKGANSIRQILPAGEQFFLYFIILKIA